MLEIFDGTPSDAIFECVGSPAGSRANSICVVKEWN